MLLSKKMNIRLIIRENKVKKKIKPYYEPKLDDSAHFVNENKDVLPDEYRNGFIATHLTIVPSGKTKPRKGFKVHEAFSSPEQAFRKAENYIGPGHLICISNEYYIEPKRSKPGLHSREVWFSKDGSKYEYRFMYNTIKLDTTGYDWDPEYEPSWYSDQPDQGTMKTSEDYYYWQKGWNG